MSLFLRTAIVLGLLSCIGPFAIDMYLPALPDIGADLGADAQAMQGTIIGYFIAFGLAQMIYGPWADARGRRGPMTFGVVVFLAGSILCALAPTVGWLIAGRVVQGLGGAAVMVIPRAVIRDLFTGHQATRMMAAVMMVISVSPFLAPLAGTAIMALGGWRPIFAVLAGAAAVSLLLIRFALPETLAPANRQPFDIAAMKSGLSRLFGDRGFMILTFLGAFGMASFFVFIAAASFVYAGHFGLTPFQFSLAFAVNAAGFFIASQAAAGLGMRHGALRVALTATTGFMVATVGLFLIALAAPLPLWLMMAGLFAANACLGLVIPTVMVLALDDQGEIAGLASSLGGTLQMVTGGVMAAAAGPFFDGTPVPMLGAIALCGVAAFGLTLAVPRRQAAA
jgi:DHA1 family bicyclomycin/chloramphenicol resistance-like MFS transporter